MDIHKEQEGIGPLASLYLLVPQSTKSTQRPEPKGSNNSHPNSMSKYDVSSISARDKNYVYRYKVTKCIDAERSKQW